MYIADRSRMCSSFIRKDKFAGQVFGSGFSWSEAVDAIADIYNGVSSTLRGSSYADSSCSLSSGRC